MTVKYSFYFIGLLIFLGACKNNEKDILKLSDLDNSLELSTATINEANKTIYRSLDNKLAEPRSSQYAKIWQPKAIQVQEISNKTFEYIETLKDELRKNAILKDSTPFSLKFDKKNRAAVYAIFYKEKKSDELSEKLKEYKLKSASIDSELNVEFRKGNFHIQEDFYNTYFKNVNAISAMTMLSKFQNNIRVQENKMINFCYSQTSPVILCGYSSGPRVLIGQNTIHLKSGEALEISAGVATYSIYVNPQIKINGKPIETIDGRSIHKLRVSGMTGKHYIPVEIRFKDQDGVDQVYESKVEYIIDE